MRLSFKARQVAGVAAIVAVAVLALSIMHLTGLARVRLEESQSRGELLAHTIFQTTNDVVQRGGDPYVALRQDPGIRALLQAAIAYSKNVTYAAIVDSTGVAIAHAFPTQEGEQIPENEDLAGLLQQGRGAQLGAIYSARMLEVRERLLLGNEEFGSIRIGVSTLLIRDELERELRPALATAASALLISVLIAMLLSQWLLRPIHIIRSGLNRLGRGEFDVKLDLPPGDELAELGSSFNSVSAQLSAIRTQAAGQTANLQSVVEHLEDAVAIFSHSRELLFANPAMQGVLNGAGAGQLIDDLLPLDHPYRRLVDDTLHLKQPQGPVSVTLPPGSSAESASGSPEGAPAERLVMTHPVGDPAGKFVGVILLVRNLAYLGHVQSTLNYSRKLAALGRLLAGVAHEVKNPLNAMTIHLELLKQKLLGPSARPVRLGSVQARAGDPGLAAAGSNVVATGVATNTLDVSSVMKHVTVIADEIKRLDEVVQGFLKFSRPEELKLQPLRLNEVVDDVVHVVEPEAEKVGVAVRNELPIELPPINGDAGMLRQALMNLALNACQAMPTGGTLTIRGREAARDRVQIEVSDTGVGIRPEHLEKIFDLYFTTKERGSGIGLSMVYRTVQLHDGDVEVQSTPNGGTTFKLLLPKARAA